MHVKKQVTAALWVGALMLSGCAAPSPVAPSLTPGASSPTAADPSPTLPSPASSPSFTPRTATINVSGDLLWHNTLWRSAELDAKSGRFDFAPQLAALRDYVSAADLGICHSEVPVAAEGGPYRNYPTFAVPPEVTTGIAATGWDLCTTASNHSVDAGWVGLVRTIEAHRKAGVLTSGTFETAEAAATPVIYTTHAGVRIAVISQTFGLNGLSRPTGKDWSVNLIDADAAIAQAKAAKKAGADIVAVHLHAGDEYSSKVTAQQRAFAEAVTASPDVDFMFGQHAHVVQPVDKVNGKWVFYGLGNLIAASGPAQPYTYDGLLAQVTFTERPDGSFVASAAEYAPTMITKYANGRPARVLLISDALKAGSGDASALRASEARTRKTVNALGVEGLTERG